MSGGPGNDERFEQVGQSNVKHAFTALQNNICGFGCQSSGTGTLLGAGCSDPYSASLNAGPNLGRAHGLTRLQAPILEETRPLLQTPILVILT